MNMKVGIIGVGHLGRIHLQQWLQIERVEVVGFFDPFDENANKAIEMGITRFSSVEELIQAADAIDIVSTTTAHYELACLALQHKKHVFIEKPITHSLQEAQHLLQLVQEAGVKGQVGHVERFNPGFLSIKDYSLQPLFIECHRLAQFNPRGTDVSVILDLMIHDIDIILSVVKSKVTSVAASGVAVVSESLDIANARLEFENGCVANITASRMALKKMRKIRFFQKDAYIGVDFLEKKSEICRLSDTAQENDWAIPLEIPNQETRYIHFEAPNVVDSNAIRTELSMFRDAIEQDIPCAVSFEDGYNALLVASEIYEQIIQKQKK